MTDQERETEVVVGVVGGIIQKAESKWQVEVTPAGSQYGKKLWTKSPDQVAAATALIGQQASFLCNVSHWTNQEGKPVRSLWVDAVNPGVAPSVPVASGGFSSPASSGRDDTRVSIERQTALKAAVELYSPNDRLTVEEVLATAARFAAFLESGAPGPVTTAAGSFHAPLGPDEDIPFRALDRYEVQ